MKIVSFRGFRSFLGQWRLTWGAATKLHKLEGQVADLQHQIADIKARQAKRRAAKGTKAKAKPGKSAARKQSVSKVSPGVNGNGTSKKPRKSKDFVYRDDEDMESEEESSSITLIQKQDLAEKIQVADGDTLSKAIAIIQQSTNLGGVSVPDSGIDYPKVACADHDA